MDSDGCLHMSVWFSILRDFPYPLDENTIGIHLSNTPYVTEVPVARRCVYHWLSILSFWSHGKESITRVFLSNTLIIDPFPLVQMSGQSIHRKAHHATLKYLGFAIKPHGGMTIIAACSVVASPPYCRAKEKRRMNLQALQNILW